MQIAAGAKVKYTDDLVLEPVGTIGAGGNSGFQALNLAVQFGARDILLIGFDMSDIGGAHWYGRNRWAGANNPSHTNFRKWIAAFDAAAPVLRARGVNVFNASPLSALTCFPKATVHEFVQRVGLAA